MKKLLALGIVACLPAGLALEEPGDAAASALGTVSVLVIEDSAPLARDVACARAPGRGADRADCAAVHRAVLAARLQKVSALRERGRWM